MTPLPGETAQALRLRLMTDLAKGSSWRAALSNARLMVPDAAPALDELEALPVTGLHGGVLLQPPSKEGSRVLGNVVGWMQFYLVGVVSLVIAGGVASLMSRKVTPVLCSANGLSTVEGAARCGDTLGLLGALALPLAVVLSVVTVVPVMRRVGLGRRLLYAGRLAGLGLGIGDAMELAFGRDAAQALPADYLEAADARHGAAAEWLETVGTRLVERPDGPVVRALGWAIHAAAWALGAYAAVLVYGTIFALGASIQ